MSTLESLKRVLIESQDSQNVNQLIKAFSKIYHEVSVEEFWSSLLFLLKHVMVVYDRELAVEKTIEFIAMAVTDLAIKAAKNSREKQAKGDEAESEDSEEEEDMHPLLWKIFEFLLEVHNAKDRGVRFRVCQLITRLLHNLGEGAKIDDCLYDQIYRSMVERLRDKCPLVRVHAVLSLTRLQDPSDEDCPITKAYLILMSRDPNVEVRRIILTSVAPSSISLPGILERTHDVKDTVRRTAYTVIAEKIPFRALKIEQRIQLLQDGLNDRSDMVKSVVSNKLLQVWLTACQANVLDMLARLDVHSSAKVCESALAILFNNSGVLELVNKFDVVDEQVLIPEDKLTCESAFYWRTLVQFVHKAGHEYEEQLDRIRPNCLQFCNYLKNVAGKLIDCSEIEKMLDIEFIVQQLLQILSCMDLTDQAARKGTESMLLKLLLAEHVGPSLVEYIVPCVRQLYMDTDTLIHKLLETISEIREPITTVEAQVSVDQRRQLDKKIAGIRVRLNQLREELGQHVEQQNFEKAAEIKACISNLDAERSSLLEESEPQLNEVRTEKNDPLTILKCLTIACELLTSTGVRTLTPALHTLMESQILPGMVNEESEVRNVAVKAIGLCCLIGRDVIMQHLPLLLQATQMDTQVVRCTALKSIFDLVHVYGLDAFSDQDNTTARSNQTEESTVSESGNENTLTKETGEDKSMMHESTGFNDSNLSTSGGDKARASVSNDRNDWSGATGKVIAILSACLDNENGELRTLAVEGMAKLLLSGRLVSSKMLSHLLLLWYNPIVDDDLRLRQCLGVFFPLFAFTSSENQELIEEAFVPTLKTLLQAPSTSPLAEINENSVASFMVELTNAQHLVSNQNSVVKENPCHDSLAVKLSNEILGQPHSFHSRLWLRVLGQLCLSQDNLPLLKDLDTMTEKMASLVTERQCIKLLEKFRDQVKNMLAYLEEKQTVQLPDPSSSGEGEGREGVAQVDGETDCITKEISALEISQRGEVEQPQGSVPSDRKIARGDKSTKTPMRSTRSSHVPKSAKSVQRRTNTSILENGGFATPAPLRGSRLTAEIEDTRINLENLLVEGKTPTHGKTPKTPKRPLHSIQDPAFTE